MNSREVVLGRIRDAITLAPAREGEIPRNYRTGRTMSDEELIDLFVDRLVDYKAHVHHCAATEIAEAVAGILKGRGLHTLGIPMRPRPIMGSRIRRNAGGGQPGRTGS